MRSAVVILVSIVAIFVSSFLQSTPIRVALFLTAQVESALIVGREIVLGRLRLRRIVVSFDEQLLQQIFRALIEIVDVVIVQGKIQFTLRCLVSLRGWGLSKTTGRQ